MQCCLYGYIIGTSLFRLDRHARYSENGS